MFARNSRSIQAESSKVPERSTDCRLRIRSTKPRRFRYCRPPGKRIPHSLSRWPVNAVVVVLPFDPVIPMTGPLRKYDASSTSPITGIPPSRAETSMGRSYGTPGESTIVSGGFPRPSCSPFLASPPARPSGRIYFALPLSAVEHPSRAPWRRASTTTQSPPALSAWCR